MADTLKKATFSQSRNDMHWSIYDSEDGRIIWAGYDDSNWWDKVSPTDHARNRAGKFTGRLYRLNHKTSEVEVLNG
jgi:hypothetical protein